MNEAENGTETAHSEQIVHEKHPVSSAEINTLLGKLIRTQQPGDDSRMSKRRSVSITIPVIPVDADGRPVGTPFLAMSRDISPSGISLIHTRATTSRFLLVELRAPKMEKVKLLTEVMRCRATGRFYEIGGKFISRFSDRPPEIASPSAAGSQDSTNA